MYWQVYLHKTVLSAENMLIKVKRAKELSQLEKLFGSYALNFLKNNFTLNDFRLNESFSIIH